MSAVIIILVIVLIVGCSSLLVLLGGGGGAAYYFSQDNTEEEEEEESPILPIPRSSGEEEEEEEEELPEEEEEEEEELEGAEEQTESQPAPAVPDFVSSLPVNKCYNADRAIYYVRNDGTPCHVPGGPGSPLGVLCTTPAVVKPLSEVTGGLTYESTQLPKCVAADAPPAPAPEVPDFVSSLPVNKCYNADRAIYYVRNDGTPCHVPGGPGSPLGVLCTTPAVVKPLSEVTGGLTYESTQLPKCVAADAPPAPAPEEWKRLVSKRNRALGVAVYGNAREQGDLRLHSACAPGSTNPQCLWKITSDGRLVTKAAPNIGANGWGYSNEGSQLKTTQHCGPGTTNQGCLYSLDASGRLTNREAPARGVNAWGGAANNTYLRHTGYCPSGTDNPDCLWAFEPFSGGSMKI